MKSKVCKFYLLIITGLLYTSAFAQFQITGFVYDQLKSPIANAEMYIEESGKQTITDSLGKYRFEDIKPGAYTLIAYGYNFKIKKKNIVVNQDSTLNFTLELLGEELSEVVIAQRKKEIFGLQQLKPVEGTAIYAGKKSEVVLLDNTLGNLAGNNARQIYAQVVGLNIYESSAGGLQLNIGGRGLDPNRTANFNTRQNGYDISADVLGYPESYYTPPPEALNRIEVVRGAASLQYGTQFGGLLNFKMKTPVVNRPLKIVTRQSLGSYGLFTSFNSFSGTIGNFSYYAYYHYKTGNTFRDNSQFNSQNVYAHLGYRFSEKTSLVFNLTFLDYLAQQPGGLTDSQFELNPDFSNRTRNWFKVNWNLYSLRLEHQFSLNTEMSLNLFASKASRTAIGFRGVAGQLNFNPVLVEDEQDANGDFVNPRDVIDNDFMNFGAEARLLHKYQFLNHQSVFLIGSKYYNADNGARQGAGSLGTDADFRIRNQEFPEYPNQSEFEFPNQNIALFTENIFKINEKFSVTPGVRFEYIKTSAKGFFTELTFDNSGNEIDRNIATEDETSTRSFILGGIGLSYKVNSAAEIYANVSQNYRSVTFNDIRTISPGSTVNESISDERGGTADFGIRGTFKKDLSYDINIFGLLYADRIGNFTNTRAERERNNIGDAVIYGLESFLDWNMANLIFSEQPQYKLNLFLNTAVTRSRYTAINDGVNSQEVKVDNKVEFIPSINLKTGMNAGYRNFLASLQFTYLSEQFTDATNAVRDTPGGLTEGIKGKISAYSVLDFSLSYSFKNWKFEGGVNNFLNASYFTQRATGYPGPGIIPSAPVTWFSTIQYSW